MQSGEIQLPNGQKIKSLSKIKENCEKRHGSGKWLWKRETCKMLFKSRKIAKVIQKQVRDLSGEVKKVKREYARNCYRNMSQDMQKHKE